MACHESVHYNLLSPKKLNEIFGLLLCSIVGIHYARYREQHFRHHKAIFIKEDPDSYIYLPMLKASPGLPRIAVWIAGIPFEIIKKFREKSIEKNSLIIGLGKEKMHGMAVLVANLIVFIVYVIFGHWWEWILFWLLPLLTIALFLNRTRVWVEHGYIHAIKGIHADDIDNQKMETIDIASNRVENFIIAPFSFNYHLTHHTIPSVPYYKNRALSKILVAQNKFDYSRRLDISYIEAIKKIIFV